MENPVTSLRSWGWLLGVTLVLRLVLGWYLPVSPDEAYYWVWAHAPATGYLDHPPMVALWIRAGCALFGDGGAGIRWIGTMAAMAAIPFLAQAIRDFHAPSPEAVEGAARAGMIRGVALLQATLAMGVNAVVMTPDTPLLFFTTLMLWAVGRLMATGHARWWPVCGAMLGLAFDSKYTAVLPGAGIVAWLLLHRAGRAWLRRPAPWAGALVAVAVISPVIWWNATHHWASLLRQGGRVGDWHAGRALGFLGELVGGQVGLATPGIFVLFLAGVVLVTRNARRVPAQGVLLWMIVVPTAVFVTHALGDRVQANWPVILYPLLAVAAAQLTWKGWKPAVALGGVLCALVFIQAAFEPLSLSAHTDVMLRQVGGWPGLADEVEGRAMPGDFVTACDYGTASELALYLPRRAVVGMEPRWALFNLPHGIRGEGLMLCNPRRTFDRRYFATVEPVGSITRHGRIRDAERLDIYRVRMNDPVPPDLLPDIAILSRDLTAVTQASGPRGRIQAAPSAPSCGTACSAPEGPDDGPGGPDRH
ncbi:glycosyltransferase family 39 protein [Gluconacetobacter entanii]|nr:glycosyltransferase family 39 protein [Gluconacetobacter entanii]MCW4581804.1 glycosyltransferase family 39 protein [Gluconacetobacter entanii]MCW4585078.1 glycosyltransferase family 39 protein [Gluconacetobacter entanii]MCW4588760.1 glycosyltransferase family 39 protein [Gluconacetobacter entanii]